MKRTLALILAAGMLLAAFTACKNTSGETQAAVTSQQETDIAASSGEYERAVLYGFVPDGADPDAPVTERELADSLATMLAAHDASLTAEWNEFTKDAGSRAVKRDYGALFLLLAAERMGCATFTDGFAPTAGNVDWDAMWNSMTQDYPLFNAMCWNTCESISAERDWEWELNYPTAALQYVLSRLSQKSGAPLLDLDEKNSLRCDDDMTVREAAVGVLRLYESVSRPADVLELSTCTIPDDVLQKAKTMPTVSSAALPAWRGTNLPLDSLPWRENGRENFEQSDIQQIADMGFNYVRIGCLHTELTSEEGDVLCWNASVLKNIDNILGWCIELGIHVCLDMHSLPGSSSGYVDVTTNTQHVQQSVEIWSMLSKRYQKVSANALSYNLVNEPTIYGYGSEEAYADFAYKLIAAIRENDTEKLIVSDGMLMDAWYNACPSAPCKALDNSIAQTIHLYPFNSLARSNYLALQTWPYEHQDAVSGAIHGGSDLTLKGTFPAGSELVLHVREVHTSGADNTLRWTLDGKDAGSHVFTGLARGVDECTSFIDEGNDNITARFGDDSWEGKNGYMLTVPITSDTQQITLSVDSAMYVNVSEMLIKRPTATQQAYLVPQNASWSGFAYETGPFEVDYLALVGEWAEGNSEIVLAQDGTYTSPTALNIDMFDYESLRACIKGWADWSKETGTPILCNEFGIPIGLPEGVRRAYLDAILGLLEEYHIPWALYTNNYDIWGPLVYVDESTKCTLPADGSYEMDGNYAIDSVLLEEVHKYTGQGSGKTA